MLAGRQVKQYLVGGVLGELGLDHLAAVRGDGGSSAAILIEQLLAVGVALMRQLQHFERVIDGLLRQGTSLLLCGRVSDTRA